MREIHRYSNVEILGKRDNVASWHTTSWNLLRIISCANDASFFWRARRFWFNCLISFGEGILCMLLTRVASSCICERMQVSHPASV